MLTKLTPEKRIKNNCYTELQAFATSQIYNMIDFLLKMHYYKMHHYIGLILKLTFGMRGVNFIKVLCGHFLYESF